MTDQIREQLSALLDGELPKDEMGLLVRRLEKDAALRRAFGSYALIGETLRAPGGRVATTGFAARVSAAIDDSTGVSPVAQPGAAAGADAQWPLGQGSAVAAVMNPVAAAGGQRVALWQRPMVRTALAASAAAAAVLLFRPDAAPVVADLGPPAVAADVMANSSPTPAQSQRLASYMVVHSQYSTPLVRRNVLTSLLAADPGITRVSYEMGEAP
jgi:sigma-E factor negative regulatory protein RseA